MDEVTYLNAEAGDKRCESPVFKCVNHTKAIPGNNLDSSDYDIPSYQINQSSKSKTSSKHGSETSESVLPFSPIFSPIFIPPTTQFHPPSIHSLGTVVKTLDKSCKNKVNRFLHVDEDPPKSRGLFESLGMNDKDVSWVSSMASPPPNRVPGSEFNTVEKATFLPEDKFQNIQPRALFSPNMDDDFGCHPISFCSGSEDGDDDAEAYKSNMRLSDVCATLRLLEVKSLDQASDHSAENVITTQEKSLVSPVIRTKKNKTDSVKKRKKGVLVVSPDNERQYEFAVKQDKVTKCEIKSDDCSNFIEDDSFQSMSFSCIDELCKTLVTEESTSSIRPRSTDCDKTLSDLPIKNNISKIFYDSKTTPDVYKVSSLNDLDFCAEALEGEGMCTSIQNKMDKSFADKGIMRFDILSQDIAKVDDARKHLQSEETVTDSQKEKAKNFEESTGWEKMKEYMSESQLNVSDSEIFRTVENLEKTLAGSQDSKDLAKLNGVNEAESSLSEDLGGSSSTKTNSETTKEEEGARTSECGEDGSKTCQRDTEAVVAFANILGSKISVSEKALNKAREILRDCDEKLLPGKPSQSSGGFLKKSRISDEASASSERNTSEGKLDKVDAVEEAHCIEQSKGNVGKAVMEGFLTGSGKEVKISVKALERAKALMAECEEDSEVARKGTTVSGGFFTCSGKEIQVSAKALEKVKALMKECDEGLKEGSFAEGFSTTYSNKKEVTEKAEAVGEDCDKSSKGKHYPSPNREHKSFENPNERPETKDVCQVFDNETEKLSSNGETFPNDQENAGFGFSNILGSKVKVSSRALEKAKSFWCQSEESVMELSGNLVPRQPSLMNFSESEPVSATAKEENKNISVPEDSRNVGDSLKGSKLDKVDVCGLDGSDEWDEIIPSWLHVYNTSPTVASDRTLSPLMVHEDESSSGLARDYIVRSPVLGAGDRFFGKRKRRKLQFEEEKKENHTGVADRGRKGGAKRASTLAVDFSVPFKRVKFVDKVMSAKADVREGRARRREEQEKVIKEKMKVKPSEGAHLRRKRSEKQISWKEAVGGSPPGVHSEQSLKSFGVKESVLNINIRNAASFTFKGEDFFGPSCDRNVEGIPAGDECVLILDDDNNVGVEEVKRAFLASPGVQPTLVAEGWLENHFKWIVWKLSHYERSFPRYFAGRCLTPDNVMLQLRYRYDREIDRNERSALKKILERDDTSVKRMVLCVCGIEKTGVSIASKYELNLTDGWYSCPARSDAAMSKLIDEGKVFVGTKLMIQGAVLVNCEEGVAPLEIRKDVHLKISTNSTRRARWDTKLGFQRNPQHFPVSLSSIFPGGGTISRIDVIIVRIYPVLYMEKTSDGRHVTRNRRGEEKADAEYRKIQEQKMESICNEVRTEMRKAVDHENRLGNCKQMKDMCEVMEGGSDHSALQEPITTDRKKLLDENDRLSRELADKVQKRLEKENLHKRNVSEFFRAKIVDSRRPDYNNPAVLSVWHPTEDLLSLLKEGKVLSLTNITVSNSPRACKPLQINTLRQTQYKPICRSVKYPARKATQLKDISSKVCPAFEEVDVVAVVVTVKDVSHGSRLSQVVYLADSSMNYAGIVFWGSIKNYDWENTLKAGSVVACSNLQWKRNDSPQDVPSLYVNESSVFTENPKQSHMKEEMARLKQSLPQDVADFLSKCEEDLVTKLEESRWRANSSRNESTPRETHADRFRERNVFESKPTASSTPIKPFASRLCSDEAEPSPIEKRIERLQAYGEPPSLMPLVISSSNSGRRKFRRKSLHSRTSQ